MRGDLAVAGPMPDLALELAVLAGPDELAEGVRHRLALPPPRHDRLAGFRVMVINEHPLCPANLRDRKERARGYDARALVGGITAWHAIGGTAVPLDISTYEEAP
jgi:hypothetical protein